jgi:hypothetical protein
VICGRSRRRSKDVLLKMPTPALLQKFGRPRMVRKLRRYRASLALRSIVLDGGSLAHHPMVPAPGHVKLFVCGYHSPRRVPCMPYCYGLSKKPNPALQPQWQADSGPISVDNGRPSGWALALHSNKQHIRKAIAEEKVPARQGGSRRQRTRRRIPNCRMCSATAHMVHYVNCPPCAI